MLNLKSWLGIAIAWSQSGSEVAPKWCQRRPYCQLCCSNFQVKHRRFLTILELTQPVQSAAWQLLMLYAFTKLFVLHNVFHYFCIILALHEHVLCAYFSNLVAWFDIKLSERDRWIAACSRSLNFGFMLVHGVIKPAHATCS